MPFEKSAGAVIFRTEVNKTYYLVLRYPANINNPKKEYWGFPKGRIEKGEKPEQTAKREIKEETGLREIEIVKGFEGRERYFFSQDRKKISKLVTYFLAETKTKEIKISDEHLDFQWLSYEEALKRLTFENARRILKKAHKNIKAGL